MYCVSLEHTVFLVKIPHLLHEESRKVNSRHNYWSISMEGTDLETCCILGRHGSDSLCRDEREKRWRLHTMY